MERYAKMKEEGSAANYFAVVDGGAIAMTEVTEKEEECEFVIEMTSLQGLKEGIMMLRNEGCGVNNNNDPVLENIPGKKRKEGRKEDGPELV